MVPMNATTVTGMGGWRQWTDAGERGICSVVHFHSTLLSATAPVLMSTSLLSIVGIGRSWRATMRFYEYLRRGVLPVGMRVPPG